MRNRIGELIPFYPARQVSSNRWGEHYRVDILLPGPDGGEAPVRTGWIYKTGEDFPRLTTLYVRTEEWRRMGKRGRIEP